MQEITEKLKFGKGNAKLGKEIHTFSLPAGHSCPGACKCLAKVDPDTGKLTDGKKAEFRCFAASQESQYSTVRKARWFNYIRLLQCKTAGRYDKDKMAELIQTSLPDGVEKLRVHVSGDFFCQEYFDAWMQVAEDNPRVVFYAYTKSLRFWVNRLVHIPDNFRLTASRGGNQDKFIDQYSLPEVHVVYHPDDAGIMEIDHDDSHAMDPDRTKFALLIHGTQPADTKASKAVQHLKTIGFSGYNRKRKTAGGSHVRQKPIVF